MPFRCKMPVTWYMRLQNWLLWRWNELHLRWYIKILFSKLTYLELQICLQCASDRCGVERLYSERVTLDTYNGNWSTCAISALRMRINKNTIIIQNFDHIWINNAVIRNDKIKFKEPLLAFSRFITRDLMAKYHICSGGLVCEGSIPWIMGFSLLYRT